jgi:hypothetical protein
MTVGDLMRFLSEYDPETPFGVLALTTDQDERLQFYEHFQLEELLLNEDVDERPLSPEYLHSKAYDLCSCSDSTSNEERDRLANEIVANAERVVSLRISNYY